MFDTAGRSCMGQSWAQGSIPIYGTTYHLTTEYQENVVLPSYHFDNVNRVFHWLHAKMSEDRKTLYYYHTGGAGGQYNSVNETYTYAVIG